MLPWCLLTSIRIAADLNLASACSVVSLPHFSSHDSQLDLATGQQLGLKPSFG